VLCILAYTLLAWSNGRTAAAPAFTVIQGDVASQAQSRLPAASTTTDPAAGEPAIMGKRLYKELCASCHGAEGEGVAGLGSAVAGTAWVQRQSDAELLAFMRAGRPANDPANQSGIAMPPSGGRSDLTDTELLAIIHYLRTDLATPVAP
jgi:cytochrome c5